MANLSMFLQLQCIH